jgi:hypothetical protein
LHSEVAPWARRDAAATIIKTSVQPFQVGNSFCPVSGQRQE